VIAAPCRVAVCCITRCTFSCCLRQRVPAAAVYASTTHGIWYTIVLRHSLVFWQWLSPDLCPLLWCGFKAAPTAVLFLLLLSVVQGWQQVAAAELLFQTANISDRGLF
jgi:hypothetical protein